MTMTQRMLKLLHIEDDPLDAMMMEEMLNEDAGIDTATLCMSRV